MEKWLEDKKKVAIDAEQRHRWAEASELFFMLGHHCKHEKSFDEAADYFMRAAIAGERCEWWRQLGYVWVQCASALETRPTGAVSDMYDPLEGSKHFFPTLDLFAWDRFSHEEKIGRAYRNAGYHLEKAGSNQSAYVQYTKAGYAFQKAGNLDEASRTFYRALVSFVDRNGELDEELLGKLESVNKLLIKEDERKYLKRCQLYYRGLSGRLLTKGNFADANKLFVKESEVTRRLAWKDRRLAHWFGYTLWRYSCWYGNSFAIWSGWALFLFIFLFPILFSFLGALVWQEKGRETNWFDYVYFSTSTVTSGGDNSFVMTSLGKELAFLETVMGLLMLGALVTLLAKKLFR